jgi:hypothetical protein
MKKGKSGSYFRHCCGSPNPGLCGFVFASCREIAGKNIGNKFRFGLESEKYGNPVSRCGIKDRARIVGCALRDYCKPVCEYLDDLAGKTLT